MDATNLLEEMLGQIDVAIENNDEDLLKEVLEDQLVLDDICDYDNFAEIANSLVEGIGTKFPKVSVSFSLRLFNESVNQEIKNSMESNIKKNIYRVEDPSERLSLGYAILNCVSDESEFANFAKKVIKKSEEENKKFNAYKENITSISIQNFIEKYLTISTPK